MVACFNGTNSSENMLWWLTVSLLTCRASALKMEHSRSFLQSQWHRLDKTLIKTLRSHPRLLSASLPQICWCQIPWQLKGGCHWCNPQAAVELCLPASPKQGPSPKQTFLPCHGQSSTLLWLISLSARKPAPIIYFIQLFIFFPPETSCCFSGHSQVH